MLKLKQVPGGLEISLTDDFDVVDFESIMAMDGTYHTCWTNLLDHPGSGYLGNDWHYLGGNYGLTDGPVIAYGARYDSDDSEKPDGYDHVYWFSEYETRDEFPELIQGKTLFFQEVQQDTAPDGGHDDRPYQVCITSGLNDTGIYIVNGPNGVLNLVSEVLGDTSGLKCTDEYGYGVLDTDFDIAQITLLACGEDMQCGTWANQHGDRVIVQPMSDAAIEEARRLFAIPEVTPVAPESEGEKFLHIIPISSRLHIYIAEEYAELFWAANEFDEDDIESHTTILANLLEWGGYMESGEYTIVWPHQVDIPDCGIMIGYNVVLGDPASDAHDKVVSHCGLWKIDVSDMLSELYHNYEHTTQSRIQ